MTQTVGNAVRDVSVMATPAGPVAPDSTPVADFFARPVLALDYDWTNTSTVADFRPLRVFLNNPAVKSHCANFKFMRFRSFTFTIQLTASPYHYGLLQVYALPESFFTSNTINSLRAIQAPFTVAVTATGTTTAELVLPFVSKKGVVDLCTATDAIDNTAFGSSWRVGVIPVSTLRHASLADPGTLRVRIHMRLNDATLFAPTMFPVVIPAAKGARKAKFGKEFKKDGAVSSFATKVETVAAAVREKLPMVAPFASALETGAGLVASVASIFGFSKPPSLERHVVSIQRPFPLMSTTEGVDTVDVLAADPKCSRSIDPNIEGLMMDDSLTIGSIVGRESLFGSYTWSSATGDGIIGYISVSPKMAHMIWSDPGYGMMFQPTSLCYGSMPFNFWRGSIRYKFLVVCSEAHRGRLRFSYIPGTTLASVPTTVDPANTADNVIMDIAETTEITLDVGYCASQTWLPMPFTYYGFTTIADWDDATSPNGYIRIEILDPLKGLIETTTVSMLVYVSAGDDFQLNKPDMDNISSFQHSPLGNWQGAQSVNQPPGVDLYWPADVRPAAKAVMLRQKDVVADHASAGTFGENYFSYRPLLFANHEYLDLTIYPITLTNGCSMFEVRLPSYPYDTFAFDLNSPIQVADLAAATTHPTLWNWLAVCHHVVRGGHRYKVLLNKHITTIASNIPQVVSPVGLMPRMFAKRRGYNTTLQVLAHEYVYNISAITPRWATAINFLDEGEPTSYGNPQEGTLDIQVPDMDINAYHVGDEVTTLARATAVADAVTSSSANSVSIFFEDVYGEASPSTMYRLRVYHSCADDVHMALYLGAPPFLGGTTDGTSWQRDGLNRTNPWRTS